MADQSARAHLEITGTLGTSSGTGPAITIAAGTSPVTEGADAEFTVTADSAPSADLTVNLTVSESGDFVASGDEGSATVTITASNTTATLSVPTVNDSADETDGTVTATVATGTGYTVGGTSSASVTVNDDDDTLVANTTQTDGGDASLANDHAQAFTTGTNGTGYKLTGVDLELELSSGNAPTYTVKIFRSNEVGGSNVPLGEVGELTQQGSADEFRRAGAVHAQPRPRPDRRDDLLRGARRDRRRDRQRQGGAHQREGGGLRRPGRLEHRGRAPAPGGVRHELERARDFQRAEARAARRGARGGAGHHHRGRHVAGDRGHRRDLHADREPGAGRRDGGGRDRVGGGRRRLRGVRGRGREAGGVRRQRHDEDLLGADPGRHHRRAERHGHGDAGAGHRLHAGLDHLRRGDGERRRRHRHHRPGGPVRADGGDRGLDGAAGELGGAVRPRLGDGDHGLRPALLRRHGRPDRPGGLDRGGRDQRPAGSGREHLGADHRADGGQAYRVQVRAMGDLESPWSSSGSGTPANRAPRLLELISPLPPVGENRCQEKTDPTTPAAAINSPADSIVSLAFTERLDSETGELPARCFSNATSIAPFDDPDGDALTYTFVESSRPDNVVSVQGRPSIIRGRLWHIGAAAFQETNLDLSVTGTDPGGLSVTGTFRYVVTALSDGNGAPTFGSNTVAAQTYTANQAITELQLPAASGGDLYVADHDGDSNTPEQAMFSYGYEVTGLPDGLSFDPATRKITGTPTTAGTTTVTYTAEDADSKCADAKCANNVTTDRASLTFDITVNAAAGGISGVAISSTPTRDADADGTPDTYLRNDNIEVTVTWGADVTWDVSAMATSAITVTPAGGHDHPLPATGHGRGDERHGARADVPHPGGAGVVGHRRRGVGGAFGHYRGGAERTAPR